MKALFESKIDNLELISRGKVRDIYNIDSTSLLFVASDRISAFDVVMNEAIPQKGKILTQIANYWFKNTKHIINNHIIESDFENFPSTIKKYEELKDRSIIVKKAKTLPIEFIVRGFVAGSGWNEYRKHGTICGIAVKQGLKQFEKLEKPILTPSTKADEGHDVNITPEKMAEIIGKEKADYLSQKAIELFNFGYKTLLKKGIILADTKFEFGELENGDLILIDEVMTPDSSRFWKSATYQAGKEPNNFDKQTLRNWLETQNWNKAAPAPKLPTELINKIASQYDLIKNLIFG